MYQWIKISPLALEVLLVAVQLIVLNLVLVVHLLGHVCVLQRRLCHVKVLPRAIFRSWFPPPQVLEHLPHGPHAWVLNKKICSPLPPWFSMGVVCWFVLKFLYNIPLYSLLALQHKPRWQTSKRSALLESPTWCFICFNIHLRKWPLATKCECYYVCIINNCTELISCNK